MWSFILGSLEVAVKLPTKMTVFTSENVTETTVQTSHLSASWVWIQSPPWTLWSKRTDIRNDGRNQPDLQLSNTSKNKQSRGFVQGSLLLKNDGWEAALLCTHVHIYTVNTVKDSPQTEEDPFHRRSPRRSRNWTRRSEVGRSLWRPLCGIPHSPCRGGSKGTGQQKWQGKLEVSLKRTQIRPAHLRSLHSQGKPRPPSCQLPHFERGGLPGPTSGFWVGVVQYDVLGTVFHLWQGDT